MAATVSLRRRQHDWPRPAYEVWDPARLEDWIGELDRLGVRYCVLTDHTLRTTSR